MIFSHSRTIIFIDKEKIRWAKCHVPDGKIFGAIQELQWSEDNLRSALADISKIGPRRARVVVGEEFSYVTRFRKGKKASPITDDVRALIPEDLQGGWDSREEEKDIVQVMAVQQKLFSVLQKELAKTDIRVEAVESESIAVSRLLPVEKDRAILFARQDGKIILGAFQNGIILATKIFYALPSQEQTEEFLNYLSNQKAVSFDHVYIQDKSGELKNFFKQFKLETREFALDPIAGICRKKDINGRDKAVLNIALNKTGNQGGKKNNKNKQKTGREKILLLAFVFIIAASAAAVYYIQKSRQNKAEIKQPPVQKNQGDQPGLTWGK